EDILEQWLLDKLKAYSRRHPTVINHVSNKARVYVSGTGLGTIPEPDVAAYRGYPLHLPYRQIKWRNVSPLLVAEVPSSHDAHKDFFRNVRLYLRVRSIKEYWLLDGRN